MIRRTHVATAAALLVAMAGLGACTEQHKAERAGKDLGESICDLKDADSTDEARLALSDIDEQVKSMTEDNSLWTADDQTAIDQEMANLETAVADKDRAAGQQALASMHKTLQNATRNASDLTKAAVDGVQQGLEDCRGDDD